MKRYLIVSLLCVLCAFVIPISAYYISMLSAGGNYVKKVPSSGEIKVYFHKENVVKKMDVEEYLYGVVAAEMPATFEMEALKAQAVAARSYTYYRKANPTSDHPEADVCTDYTHCKAYKTAEELKNGWGENNEAYAEKVKNAVNKTAGEVITYNGEAAMAVFHSQAGGGKTENSKDVWGGDIPYLVSVESHGEEDAPNFHSTVKLSFEEISKKLSEKHPEIVLNSINEIEITDRNAGGSVKSVRLGNGTLTGRDIRSLFGLRSTCFEIEYDENSISFEVSGYGHGVGMSQYGANTLSKEGYTYVEILQHYYTGTELNNV